MGGLKVANPVVTRTVDGSYSGEITVTAGTDKDGGQALVFVHSELLGVDLVLTMDAADDLGYAISTAAAEACHRLGLPDSLERYRARHP